MLEVGKKVILYFYPKDNTPGCTKQASVFSLLADPERKVIEAYDA